MRVYQIATWLWVGVFAVRALVQGWLYSRGDATALGFVNILLDVGRHPCHDEADAVVL